jgi:tetratricopeptide (TPR) repeat protein
MKTAVKRSLLYFIPCFLPWIPVTFAATPQINQSIPYLNYSNNLRILTVDLETLDSTDSIIPTLLDAIDQDFKKNPSYVNENHFSKGQLLLTQGKYEKAHAAFQGVSKEHALYGTTLFFDGITLQKMGTTTKSLADQEKYCKESIDALEKVNELSPAYFQVRQAKEIMRSTFCYFEAIVKKGRMNQQQEQWFQNTLRSSTAWIEKADRERVYFQYFDTIKPSSNKDEIQSYLEFGFSIFPKNSRLLEEAKAIQMTVAETEEVKQEPIEKTESEAIKLFEEAKELRTKNQIKSALSKFIEIITKYPGSYTGEKAKKEITATIKNEVKWRRQTTSLNDELKKLPPEMLFDLAKYLWNQDYNMTAYSLYSHLVEAHPFFDKASDALYSVARMHEDWSEWPKAIEFYSDLVKKYARSKFFERAHFKVGFLYYMNKDYSKAIEWLAREKTLVTDPHQKAQATYWLGKTYEKMKKPADAQAQFNEVKQKYPLTYYSFLLGIDPSVIKKVHTALPTLSIQKSHPLYLATVYLSVGLHKPARNMIQAYGNENEEHLLQIVQLFHDSGFHMFSMPNAQALSEKKMETGGLHQDLVKLIFPVKYLDIVEKESKPTSVDPLIVISLMKQESGYFERAISPSKAVGLMQLLVPTAETVARQNKQTFNGRDDLFNPEKNIKLGVAYFAQLNQRFTNDVVLSLSAYNAGPEAAAKWKNRWPNVRKDEFVELIPYQETRKYVKLILRNYSYYKWLVQNQNAKIKDFGF